MLSFVILLTVSIVIFLFFAILVIVIAIFTSSLFLIFVQHQQLIAFISLVFLFKQELLVIIFMLLIFLFQFTHFFVPRAIALLIAIIYLIKGHQFPSLLLQVISNELLLLPKITFVFLPTIT